MDMSSKGHSLTWRGPVFHGGGRIYERLDRGLCNDRWRVQLPKSFVKVLPRVDFSDHHPIVISLKDPNMKIGLDRFKFESAWLLEKRYHDFVKNTWNNKTHEGCRLE